MANKKDDWAHVFFLDDDCGHGVGEGIETMCVFKHGQVLLIQDG